MPASPRSAPAPHRARLVVLTGVVALVATVLAAGGPAAAAPTGPATPAAPTATTPAADDPTTGLPEPVTGVTAHVTGPDSVAVTWDVTPGRGGRDDRVTVCRVDGTRITALTAADCSAALHAVRATGALEDRTAERGHAYSYAVLPDDDAPSGAAAGGRPVAVVLPRTTTLARTATPTRAAATATGGSVAGRVTTTAGAAVVGARAVLVGYDYPNGVVTYGEATTGSDGRYTVAVTGSPADVVQLCVDAAPAAGQPTGGWVSTCDGGRPWDGIVDDTPGGHSLDLTDAPAVTGVDVVLATGATVTGRVTSAAAGVAGASVYALGVAGGLTFRTRTGSDGRYVLRGVPEGVANLCVDPRDATVAAGQPGYAGQCADRQPWDGGVVPAAATRTTFTVGGRATVGFALATGGGLAGVVRSAGGTAVAGASVYVRAVGDAPLAPVYSNGGGLASTGGGVLAPDAVTGVDGRYRVTSLAAGRYVVCVDPATATAGAGVTGLAASCLGGAAPGAFPSGSPPRSAGTATVAPGGLTTADVGLPTGGRVTGVVTDRAGAAVANVQVRVSGVQPGTPSVVATSAANGRWNVTGLPSGSYAVCFEASAARGTAAPRGFVDVCAGAVAWSGSGVPASPAARVTVTAGASVTASVSLAAAGALAGAVSTAGTGVAGAAVSVWSGGIELPQRATTGADGSYTVRGLASGSYVVCVSPDGRYSARATSGLTSRCWRSVAWGGSAAPPTTATAAKVAVGATTKAVDVALLQGASVTGRVTGAGGVALGGVTVQVASPSGSTLASATTAADGTYTVLGLSGASVLVCFLVDGATGSGGSGVLSECWRDVPFAGGSIPTTATAVPLTVGAVSSGVDAVLAAGGSLTGSVRPVGSTTGVPFTGLLAFGPDGRRVSGATAGNGSFRIDGLAAGAWRVCAQANGAVGAGGSLPTCAPSVGWTGGYYDPPPAGATVYTVTAGAVTSGAVVAVRAGGALNGTVRSDAGGGPLSGAGVVVFGDGTSPVSTTTTASDGTYRVAGLPAGGYRVCVGTGAGTGGTTVGGGVAECRIDQPWNGVVYGGPAAGTTVDTVTAGATTSGVDLSLATGGGLTGTVRVEGLEAGFGGVEVRVFDAATGTALGSTYPSVDGSWLVNGLTPGGYLVCVDPWFGPAAGIETGVLPRCAGDVAWDGGFQAAPGATPVTVTAGNLTAVAVTLPRAAGLRGTVSDSRGAPLAGASFIVFLPGGGSLGSTADGDGNFVVGGLMAGDHRVCVRSDAPGPRGGGYLPVCAGGVAWNPTGPPPDGTTVTTLTLGSVAGPVAFTLADGAAVAGTVLDATSVTGIQWASVTVFDADGHAVASVQSDETGAWRAPGLRPGAYVVCVDAAYARGPSVAGWVDACWKNVPWTGDQPPGNATRVTLGATSVVTGISPRLKRAAGFGGTVTAGSTGAAASNVQIVLFSNGTRRYDLGYTSTAFDGTYTVKGLPAGSYVVCFDARGAASSGTTAGLFGECRDGVRWDGNGLPSGTTSTAVADGTFTTGVDATLDPSAAVAGTVTAADGGAPLGSVGVYVFTSPNGRQVGYGYTAFDGTYRIGGLAAGKYVVCADTTYAFGGPSAGGYRSQCYRNSTWAVYSTIPSDATVVTASAGALRSGVSLVVTPAAAVTGTVRDAAGGAVSDAYAYLFAAGQPIRSTYVGNGTFSFKGLAAGDYRVCVDARNATGTSAGGYLSECHDDVAWPAAQTGVEPAAGATAVTVAAGSAATVPFTLAPAARISGVVHETWPGGSWQTPSLVVSTADGSVVATAYGDTDGSWSVGGLSPGTYHACVDGGMGTVGWSTPCWDQHAAAGGPTDIVLTAGTHATGVEIDIERS